MSTTDENVATIEQNRLEPGLLVLGGCPWECGGTLVTDGDEHFCFDCNSVEGGVDDTPARRQLKRFDEIYTYSEPERYDRSRKHIMTGGYERAYWGDGEYELGFFDDAILPKRN